jgi:hypothetical protein
LKRPRSSSKHDPLLMSLAESIGSTLGTIAAKADAAQKAIAKAEVTRKLEREGKKLVRRGKKLASDLRKAKLSRTARRSLRRAPAKRAVPAARKAARRISAARRRPAVRRRKRTR